MKANFGSLFFKDNQICLSSYVIILFSVLLSSCLPNKESLKEAIVPTDVQLVKYHVREIEKSLEEFTRRLYLKNPKYERDLKAREKKIEIGRAHV